jgi:hypothetical protein
MISAPAVPDDAFRFGFTHHRADGNRYVAGSGEFPQTDFIDIPLRGTPEWLVASKWGSGIIWVTVLKNGRVRAFRSGDSGIETVRIGPSNLPAGTVPHLVIQNGKPRLLHGHGSSGATSSHPIFLPHTGCRVSLYKSGRVVLKNSRRRGFDLDALPDARMIYNERGDVLVLTGRTDSYRHGILGDTVEATAVTLISTGNTIRFRNVLFVQEGSVIEGLFPIWSDINGDGRREIILTVSDDRAGARYAVYNEGGSLLAAGPSVGKGYRWRHQIAVAPFGPNDEIELAGVKTPHIGGVVEFYGFEKDGLKLRADLEGFSSHSIGSRNLDTALAGDFDGDGRVELLVPFQAMDRLGAVRRTGEGAELVWTLSTGGRLSSNLAAVTMDDGNIALGVGREDKVLRLFLP